MRSGLSYVDFITKTDLTMFKVVFVSTGVGTMYVECRYHPICAQIIHFLPDLLLVF